MTTQLSQIKWGRVTLTALVVYIVSFLTVFLIVTGYAAYLGFQARVARPIRLSLRHLPVNTPHGSD